MMKKLFLTLFSGLCFAIVSGQSNFTLTINSQTLEGKKIYLNIFDNHNIFIPIQIDSFVFEGGSAIVNGRVNQPSNIATFSVSGNSKLIATRLIVDSGKNIINVELPDGQSKLLKIKSDTKGNQIFNKMDNILDDKVDHYSKPARVNGILKIPEDLMAQITKEQLKQLETYPDDYAGLIYLYLLSRSSSNPDYSKNILNTFARFGDTLKHSALGKQVYTENTDLITHKNASRTGNKASIFHVNDINNKPFSNSSLAGQNYMIVFSATWCGPCQQELPRLKELYRIYKNRGLKVVYFNNDDNVSRWKEHVSVHQLDWINVSERLKPSQSKIQKSFGVYSIPTCLLVNKRGVIIYNSDETDVGIEHIENYIKSAICR
ncbi:TlpA disulfide reductase family protein [Pedobacter sp. L105]|uniref:TlpA family protein disulfide reductase n=1 Tax=Pedobacter sp. L105 TaxID=1641871 RepID=UPI00131C3216|nr:TlpA disulfide reductase family protein [Pedobacter sp. L105]